MRINHRRQLMVCALAIFGFLFYSFAQQPSKLIDDKDVRVEHYEDLEYPVFAQIDHIEGVVVVKVSLDETGRVVDAVALSGASMLIQDTLRNAKKWQFSPNQESAAIIVYNFRIGADCQQNSPYSRMTLDPPNFVTINNCKPPTWVQ